VQESPNGIELDRYNPAIKNHSSAASAEAIRKMALVKQS